MAEDTLTPMMAQFRSLKAKHPDAILLFRCGDFYETYQEDAVLASSILGITLTHRSAKGKGAATEMAGFPYHALDSYLPKLIRAGHRVAICDQLEDPKLTRKLVKRGITELVTPGVALTEGILSNKENNFLAAVYISRSICGLSLLDITTGEFAVAEGTVDYIGKLLMNLSPKEVLILRGTKERFTRTFTGTQCFTFELDEWIWAEKTAIERLCRHFGVKNLKGYGVAHMTAALSCAGAILYYLDDTQHTHTGHITSLRRIEEDRYMRIDGFTMRNLEILAPMNEGGRSLLQVMDKTLTPMGARMLRRWLSFPLCSVQDIEHRHNCVEYVLNDTSLRELLHEKMSQIGDMERLISKLAALRINPREMQQLRYDLEAILPLREACLQADLASLRDWGSRMDACTELKDKIAQTLSPEPPALMSKGGYIETCISAELDELRSISQNGRAYLMELQQREAERTGIQSLKIGYNSVFGYYLEVRNTFKDHVPPEWIRKQTLVGAERYITDELKTYEEKILGAEDKILALEAQIFQQLMSEASQYISRMQADAAAVATLDCFYSMATLAEERHYVRPIVDEGTTLEIAEGRHPVIETQMNVGETYVPNDVRLDTEEQQIVIITGPNMSGKSALLRQTALIVLMAQTGSFVPASKARIGWVDRIFTRVGASDNISAGESTFMVEMSEAASIMNGFTNRSLVLFDELGRGTSTYDGISIAWAIVEYLHENPKGKPRTLFATHYHELNEMEKTFPRIHNYNVAVKEVGSEVVFLRKLVPGGSAHSFGIHVAQMAGMPPSIVKRAGVILGELESTSDGGKVSKPTVEIGQSREGMQLSFFQLDDPVLRQVRDRLVHLDINGLTPLEALNILNEIQKLVRN
ncbi:MAG: DNA mismatch repair protein MutS [Bacteroidaceae bacterium]|nr:DNA mismatch repair protein MutS [Bacteroidaceae bacterium]